MADRQRWLWSFVRWQRRSRWTFFGSVALVSIPGAAGVAGFFYFWGVGGSSLGPAEFFIAFGVGAVFITLFCLGMALSNRRLERRGKALSPQQREAAIEALLGRTPFPTAFNKVFSAPSVRSVIILAVLLGGLSYHGERPLMAALVGATWLLAFLVIRWAWPLQRPPARRLAVLAVAIAFALATFVDDFFGGPLEHGHSLTYGIVNGAVYGVVAFGFATWMRRYFSPQAHPVLQAGLEVRDRALTLAREGRAGGEAFDEVIQASGGRRAAAEIAWDVLRKRPPDDEVAARALSLVDQAIRARDWGWKPWGRNSGPASAFG